MRPIEFRVWHKPTQQMYYVQIMHFQIGLVLVESPLNEAFPELSSMYQLPLSECEVMQFSGLLDQDGAKVWEGDIMRYGDSEDEYDYLEVIFLEGMFGSPDKPVYALAEALNRNDRTRHTDKVVGNIYQHAHLLSLVPVGRD